MCCEWLVGSVRGLVGGVKGVLSGVSRGCEWLVGSVRGLVGGVMGLWYVHLVVYVCVLVCSIRE